MGEFSAWLWPGQVQAWLSDWSLLPPAALRAAQAPAADALGQAGQLGIRNSMHMLGGEALPLLSAFQLRLPPAGVKDSSVLASWVTFSLPFINTPPTGA